MAQNAMHGVHMCARGMCARRCRGRRWSGGGVGKEVDGRECVCVCVSVLCLCVVGVYVREEDVRFVCPLKGVRGVSMCGVQVWVFVLSKTASKGTRLSLAGDTQ